MSVGSPDAAARAAEVARASYGRLVGVLAARSGDIAGAEDALSEALVAALRTWPATGVPDNPEAWLITTARNRQTDAWRKAARAPTVVLTPETLDVATREPAEETGATPDPRLSLMFVCAHPAIAEMVRSPLMLQTVLGFTAAEIARACVVSPAALAQALVRAKTRIKANAIPFRIPEGDDLSDRLGDVLEAVYGAYALSWTDSEDARQMQREAVFLAGLLAEMMPDEPEAQGLAALVELIHARAGARAAGRGWAPLDQQDPGQWDGELIARAEGRLARAGRRKQLGRYQLEAAIQAVHAARRLTGKTDWLALAALHSGLVRLFPTLGARVSHAAVIAEIAGPERALAALDALEPDSVRRFQPYWATRAHVLARAGRPAEALLAYDKAIALAVNAGQRAWLGDQRERAATAVSASAPRTDT